MPWPVGWGFQQQKANCFFFSPAFPLEMKRDDHPHDGKCSFLFVEIVIMGTLVLANGCGHLVWHGQTSGSPIVNI